MESQSSQHFSHRSQSQQVLQWYRTFRMGCISQKSHLQSTKAQEGTVTLWGVTATGTDKGMPSSMFSFIILVLALPLEWLDFLSLCLVSFWMLLKSQELNKPSISNFTLDGSLSSPELAMRLLFSSYKQLAIEEFFLSRVITGGSSGKSFSLDSSSQSCETVSILSLSSLQSMTGCSRWSAGWSPLCESLQASHSQYLPPSCSQVQQAEQQFSIAPLHQSHRFPTGPERSICTIDRSATPTEQQLSSPTPLSYSPGPSLNEHTMAPILPFSAYYSSSLMGHTLRPLMPICILRSSTCPSKNAKGWLSGILRDPWHSKHCVEEFPQHRGHLKREVSLSGWPRGWSTESPSSLGLSLMERAWSQRSSSMFFFGIQ